MTYLKNYLRLNSFLKFNKLDLFITYILFFPPILQAFGIGSYAPGILFCAISLAPFYLKTIIISFIKIRTFVFSIFILVFAIFSWLTNNITFNNGPDLNKFLLGLIMILSLIVLSSIFSNIYGRELTNNKIHENKFPFFTFFTIYAHVILFFRFAEFSPFYLQIDSPIGIFSEPSHIAYITGIFLFIKTLTSTKTMFVIYFISAIFFVVSISSMVGIAMLLIIAFFRASQAQKIVIVFIFFILILSASSINYKAIENLNFIRETGLTLTAAVYLSGWERAFLNLIETNFIGLGVNQLGVYGNQGYFTETIMRSSGGFHVNRFGGSFIFSKLTAEFGVFSLFFTTYLLWIWFKCFKNKNYMNNPINQGIVCCFFILFFVRSPGLACGGVVLIISLITNPYLTKFSLGNLNK